MLRVKSPQDLGAGIIFAIIGLVGLYYGKDLTYGTAARMGPGYFPMWLSGIILGMGVILVCRAMVIKGPRVEAFQIRPIFFILSAVVVFAYTIAHIGLALSLFFMTMIAVQSRSDTRQLEMILLAVGLSIGGVIVFVYVLGQAMPPWWGR
jgi:hypothetical protein